MVTVRLFAAARAAVGEASVELEAPGGTVAAVVGALEARPGAAANAADVLARCSFLVDGRATRDLAAAVPAGARVDVLPPFAGG